jgi:hypothetical protein
MACHIEADASWVIIAVFAYAFSLNGLDFGYGHLTCLRDRLEVLQTSTGSYVNGF